MPEDDESFGSLDQEQTAHLVKVALVISASDEAHPKTLLAAVTPDVVKAIIIQPTRENIAAVMTAQGIKLNDNCLDHMNRTVLGVLADTKNSVTVAHILQTRANICRLQGHDWIGEILEREKAIAAYSVIKQHKLGTHGNLSMIMKTPRYEEGSLVAGNFEHLAYGYANLHLSDQVLECCDKAEAMGIQSAYLLSRRGDIALARGNSQEAEEWYLKAIELNPTYYTTHYLLAQCRKWHADNPRDQEFGALLAKKNLHPYPDHDRYKEPRPTPLPLRFAHAKVQADLGNVSTAWTAYTEANGALEKEQRRPYSAELVERRLQDTQSIFTPEFFAERKDWGDPNAKRIFVVGMPRSGTTIIDRSLSMHSNIATSDESELGLKCVGQILTNYGLRWTQIAELNKGQVAELAETMNQVLGPAAQDGTLCIDSSPHNFIWIGVLKLLYPNAVIIHSQRNPLDTCMSNYCKLADPLANSDFSCASNLQNLGHYYTIYEKTMKFFKELFPDIHTVQYESYVLNQKQETQKMLDACRVAWEDDCMHPEQNTTETFNMSMGAVHKPVNSSSIGRWKQFGILRLWPLIKSLGWKHVLDWMPRL